MKINKKIFFFFALFCSLFCVINCNNVNSNLPDTDFNTLSEGTNINGFVKVDGSVSVFDCFWICDHEVTIGEYLKYLPYRYGPLPKEYYDCPVDYVNWCEAIVYCNLRSIAEGLTPCYSMLDFEGIKETVRPIAWGDIPNNNNNSKDVITRWDNVKCDFTANGYRLPTIAEWQYAARGGSVPSAYIYAGSDSPDKVAWYYDNYNNIRSSVKTKFPNKLGLYDMSGGVAELCLDYSSSSSIRSVAGAYYDYGYSTSTDYLKVDYFTNTAGTSYLNYSNVGFRVVRSSL